jgi:phage baseplate assembly protein W
MSLPSNTNFYGNTPGDVVQRTTTLKSPKLSGLIYPVPTSPKNGYFSKMSGLELVRSNLSSLVRTERGERFMRPDFGCNLRKFLMEPLDEVLFSMIKEEIITAVRRYLGTVSIGKLQVFENRFGHLDVKLFCSLRDAQFTAFNIGVRI